MPLFAVLEDDPRRINAMRSAVRAHLGDCEAQMFASAAEMTAWLSLRLDDVQLISLDCDLDSTAAVDDRCGSGEDVVTYLASRQPRCPVLIHSSNALRAPAMHLELTTAGCPNVVLCPFRGAEHWVADVRQALQHFLGDAP